MWYKFANTECIISKDMLSLDLNIKPKKRNTMNMLVINGMPAVTDYLLYEEEQGGSILQILIEPDVSPDLHTVLVESLEKRLPGGGVMDKPEIETENENLPGKKFSEIRLLGRSVVWFVDHLRSEGFSVIEQAP
jgi:hypothetical protein